ncbi:2-hydroxyacid dehydrogenase [Neorhizobium sp. NPDC001467]|uniref:2-hydroxyacid dehydrogenase n=1 Tax=Neorhizobium sp. NPDC001467 TaxID=3390595 RepID=UPI003D00EAA7
MTDKSVTVLIPGRIHPRVLERLERDFDIVRVPEQGGELELDEATRAKVRGVAVSGTLQRAWMDALPNLEIVSNFGVGYDGVDADHAATKGIIVTHTPDVLNDEVADTTIGLLLNTVRRLPRAEAWLRDGRWKSEGAFALSPLSLKGRHVGLLGLGRIGLEIAHRLEAFKLKVSYHTRTPRSDVSYTHYSSLREMAQAVDTLICIVPGTAATHKIINAEILSALGPNGVFINVGRGSSVDEAALEAALRSGTIAAAGLDVFYEEPTTASAFLDLDNVSLLPHVASASVPTRNAMADLVVDNLIGWFTDKTVISPVPETPVKK